MAEWSVPQRIAAVYTILFLLVVAMGYVPAFVNEAGELFGLFHIDPIDDALHLASAAWAGFAAWHSLAWTLVYFRWFGTLYLLDGVAGIAFGKGYLDGALFMANESGIADMGTRIAANIPHIVLGGFALAAGIYYTRKATTRG